MDGKTLLDLFLRALLIAIEAGVLLILELLALLLVDRAFMLPPCWLLSQLPLEFPLMPQSAAAARLKPYCSWCAEVPDVLLFCVNGAGARSVACSILLCCEEWLMELRSKGCRSSKLFDSVVLLHLWVEGAGDGKAAGSYYYDVKYSLLVWNVMPAN
ncbi:hypothetical protein Nepgr_003926 [Nepenthes gracilis]|uniref:Uncharacterized protein n=1 Tax=Nepenthes gracilis TaxID=150966 RepID=A0AAD3S0H0_NEPGR|nr:hypothetical protein Nepgr_003926 [Nepenthes gracilis]